MIEENSQPPSLIPFQVQDKEKSVSSYCCQATVSISHSPRQPCNTLTMSYLRPLTSLPSSLSDNALTSYFAEKFKAIRRETQRLTSLPTRWHQCPWVLPSPDTISAHLIPTPHLCSRSFPAYLGKSMAPTIPLLPNPVIKNPPVNYSHCYTKML